MKKAAMRNAEIDFYRICMALVIVCHHSHGLEPADPNHYPFVGGYLAVEFFFMLSGYFIVRKAMRQDVLDYKDGFLLVLKKYITFLPYIILAVTIKWTMDNYLTGSNLFDTLKNYFYSIYEILLLPEAGIFQGYSNMQFWYLSAMLIVLPLFYAGMVKNKQCFLYTIAPLSALLIYGYFSVTVGHIDTWGTWLGLFRPSLLRAWAGLCMGACTFIFSEHIKKIPRGRVMLSAVEIVCFICTMFYMFRLGRRKADFLFIILFMLMNAIALSEKASISSRFQSIPTGTAELALAIYAGHMTVRTFVPCILMPNASYWERLPIYIILSISIGFLFVFLTSMLRTGFKGRHTKTC